MIDRFLQHLSAERNYSALTVSSYRTDLAQLSLYLCPGGDEPQWQSVTASDVRAWIVDCAAHAQGARTIRRKVQAVRAFYKFLIKEGVTADSPAADLELAKLPKRLPSVVREHNLDTLLDESVDEADFRQVRDHLIVLMLYTTGMRRAELISLDNRNVDTDTCQLKVHGKRDKDRIVPFGEELKTWIEAYRKLRNCHAPQGGTFFVRENGEPLYPALVYRTVHRMLQTVGGSDKLSPHVLRHSFATAMLNNGAEINSVKELLGHESLAATQIYTHVTLSELKNNYKLAHPRALKKGGQHGN